VKARVNRQWQLEGSRTGPLGDVAMAHDLPGGGYASSRDGRVRWTAGALRVAL